MERKSILVHQYEAATTDSMISFYNARNRVLVKWRFHFRQLTAYISQTTHHKTFFKDDCSGNLQQQLGFFSLRRLFTRTQCSAVLDIDEWIDLHRVSAIFCYVGFITEMRLLTTKVNNQDRHGGEKSFFEAGLRTRCITRSRRWSLTTSKEPPEPSRIEREWKRFAFYQSCSCSHRRIKYHAHVSNARKRQLKKFSSDWTLYGR